MPKNKKLSQIKSSVFSRSLSMAKLGLNAGFGYASAKLMNFPLEDFINSQALSITKEFGELKGSLMKAGQMLSMYGEHFLPPKAVMVLMTLQSDSPPIDWAIMRRHLESYLDEQLIEELDINPESIGSASMGQVHLAVIKATGQKIALKIQYPDIDKAIDSDVAALKKILSLTKILPAGLDLTEVFEEIKTMLRQELDYTLEARQTTKYREFIGSDSRYVVPSVFIKYSNSKVLATEYLDGLKSDHALVQNLSEARRNKLSENFIELYFKEIFDWNFVQTDPHLGNYKIQIDSMGSDRLVLLDFGATKKFSSVFMENYRKMIKGCIIEDTETFMAGARGLGFVIDSDTPEYVKTFQAFCYETVEPFKAPDNYNWKMTNLPKRVVKSAIQFKNFELRSPPRDILFLDRKTAGVFTFLSVLGANINARKIIDPYLNNISKRASEP